MEESHVSLPVATPIYFYIYGLVDPRDGKVRYVGRTHNMRTRMHGHLAESALKKPTKKAEWIRDVLASGNKPTMILLETVKQGDGVSGCERKWVQHFHEKWGVTNVMWATVCV